VGLFGTIGDLDRERQTVSGDRNQRAGNDDPGLVPGEVCQVVSFTPIIRYIDGTSGLVIPEIAIQHKGEDRAY
jgi:hypothetical protein